MAIKRFSSSGFIAGAGIGGGSKIVKKIAAMKQDKKRKEIMNKFKEAKPIKRIPSQKMMMKMEEE